MEPTTEKDIAVTKTILMLMTIGTLFFAGGPVSAQVYPPASFPAISVVAAVAVVTTVPATTAPAATLPATTAAPAVAPASTALAPPTIAASGNVGGVAQGRPSGQVGSTTTGRPVAFTGANTSYHLQIALALILGGFLLVVATRRRRQNQQFA